MNKLISAIALGLLHVSNVYATCSNPAPRAQAKPISNMTMLKYLQRKESYEKIT